MSDPTISPGPIQRIDARRAASNLDEDVRRYCELAVSLGASESKVIPASAVVVDDRVSLKCAVPKCFGYNTCANCPPHSPSAERMKRVVEQYTKAVVLKVDVRPQAIVRDRETIEERVAAYKTVFRLVGAVESAAFYDGHYLAAGFGAGSCKSTFCHKSACAVLTHEKCRHNLIARPSMEAVGMDCFALASSLGWDILPVGSSASAECVASGLLMGLVLVA
jgi:predicted metal-binding protein